MTDEMMIEQRRSPLVPTLIGLTAGGGAGYLTGHLMTKPMSYEDIIKEVNGNDKFEARTKEGAKDASTWQDVKKKADEVARLKNELADVEKGELIDTELANKIKETENRIEKEIAELTKEKPNTKKAGSNIVPANNSWKMTVEQRDNYNNLYSQWETAVQTFEKDPKVTKLTNDIADRKLEYSMFYDDIVRDASNEIKATAGKKPNKRIKNFADYLEKGNGEDFIQKQIVRNNYHHLTNEEVIRHVGGDKKLSTTKPTFKPFERKTAIKVTKTDGTEAWAVFGKKELENLKEQKADRIFKDITETLEAYSKNTNKLKNLHENVTIDKSLLNSAGVTQRTIKGEKGHAYFKNGSALDFKDFVDDCITNAKQYADDARVLLDNKVHNAKIPAGATSVTYTEKVQTILDRYKVSSPNELYYELVAKQSIGNEFAAEKATLEKAIHDILARDTQLANLEGQMSNLRKGAKNVNILEKQIIGQFGNFLGKPEATIETVPGLSREQAIEKLGDTYTKLNEELNGLKEKAKTAERKAADPDKVSAAKKAVEDGEKSLREMAESLGKKMTKGPNKWLTAGIGAAAVGITTLLAVSSRNNKTQA